jgi:hypothetical protein
MLPGAIPSPWVSDVVTTQMERNDTPVGTVVAFIVSLVHNVTTCVTTLETDFS